MTGCPLSGEQARQSSLISKRSLRSTLRSGSSRSSSGGEPTEGAGKCRALLLPLESASDDGSAHIDLQELCDLCTPAAIVSRDDFAESARCDVVEGAHMREQCKFWNHAEPAMLRVHVGMSSRDQDRPPSGSMTPAISRSRTVLPDGRAKAPVARHWHVERGDVQNRWLL